MADDTKRTGAPGDQRDPTEANDDATILRPKGQQARAPAERAPADEGNNDATQIRKGDAGTSTPNNDQTVVRGGGSDSSEAEGSNDATIVRPKDSGRRKGPSSAGDAGTKAKKGESRPAAAGDSTILRSPDAPSNDSATILRGPAAPDSATILRGPEQADDNSTLLRKGERDRERESTPDVDETAPTEVLDNAGDETIIRSGDAGGGDSDSGDADSGDTTVLRGGDDDDGDATIINNDFSDDSTLLGPGAQGEDTTYIASVGRQIKPQGNSEAGRLLKNRFVLEEKIGSGGMGDVYKALDLRQQEAQERDPYIAIKLLNENFSRHKDAFLSLQRETSRTRGIPHPNIMGVYDFDREGDTVFMSMELLDGKPLDDYLKEHPEGVSHEDAWNIIDGICKGLQRAHDAGIVHSDFKPGNIFYTADKAAKVFDFGIARAVSNPGDLEADGEKTVFDAGSLGALTPTYASYEMLKGLEPSKSDDVYAVALVAYELFMGKHPYDRVPADKALERGIKPKPVPFLKRRHWKALKKGLELKGEDRTQSVDEFYEGMFSVDPPYFRYAAVATVLLTSIGFAAYQTTNVKEKPEDLVNAQDLIASSKVTLQVLNPERRTQLTSQQWESEIWHEQIQRAIEGFRVADQNIQGNPEWIEGWEDVDAPDPELEQYTQWALEAYIDKIREYRETARSYSETDEEQVEDALEVLEDANLLAKYLPTYEAADPKAVELEEDRLSRQFTNRTTARDSIVAARIAAEELAERQEEERLAREAQERFEAQRLATYERDLEGVREILECKGDISDSEIDEFGRYLTKMRSNWPEAFQQHYPTIVAYMGTCIQQRIGYVDPDRAREVQAKVVALVPGEAQIASLVIEDKDPCAERRLVGRGDRSRSWCEDKLSEGGEGPELVVVPAVNSITDFKYAISRSEITIYDYNLYCEKAGCATLGGTGTWPATGITLQQARDYANWLSSQTGQTYRLPTVREWSHAAIANNTKKVVDENINCTVDSRGVRLGETLQNAISGRANDWGLYNVVGNAREWAVSEDDGLVALGGAHTDPRQDCTFDKRVVHEGAADPVTGFRIVREIEDKDLSSESSEIAASE